MNTSHYPSLELNKQLQEKLMPHNWELFMTEDWLIYDKHDRADLDNACEWIEWIPVYSVMEMLDVIPDRIVINWDAVLWLSLDKSSVSFERWGFVIYKFIWTLPDSLAKMLVWLVENGHLILNK